MLEDGKNSLGMIRLARRRSHSALRNLLKDAITKHNTAATDCRNLDAYLSSLKDVEPAANVFAQ